MKLSIKIMLFSILAATGFVQAQSSKAERAIIKFEQKYAPVIADYKKINLKNQASEHMQRFFMNHKLYTVKVYKQLLKEYAKCRVAQDCQEKAFIDEFVDTIKMLRPEILGIMLYQDFHKEYVIEYQQKSCINRLKYTNPKHFVFVFSQKSKILTDFIEKYKPHLSASLLVQMKEMQKQAAIIKLDLEKNHGTKFVKKYSSVKRLKMFFAVGIFVLLVPIVLTIFSISLIAIPLGANIEKLISVIALLTVCLPVSVLAIPTGTILLKKSINYKNVDSDYNDWREFIV